MNPEGASLSAIPGTEERAVKGIQLDFIDDAELDGPGVGRGGVAFLGHFINFGGGAAALLGAALEFFCALLDPGEGVKVGVLCDGLDVVEACERATSRINRNFGDEEGSIEDVGMLTDGADRVKVYGILAAGKAALPASLPVLLIFNSFEPFLAFRFLAFFISAL